MVQEINLNKKTMGLLHTLCLLCNEKMLGCKNIISNSNVVEKMEIEILLSSMLFAIPFKI